MRKRRDCKDVCRKEKSFLRRRNFFGGKDEFNALRKKGGKDGVGIIFPFLLLLLALPAV